MRWIPTILPEFYTCIRLSSANLYKTLDKNEDLMYSTEVNVSCDCMHSLHAWNEKLAYCDGLMHHDNDRLLQGKTKDGVKDVSVSRVNFMNLGARLTGFTTSSQLSLSAGRKERKLSASCSCW